MTSYVLVSGDFVRTGGMDVANFSLAHYLSRVGAEVHLVAHRAAPELLAMPHVVFHRVPKPGGSYLLGAPLLRRVGRRWGRMLAGHGARQVTNGGNCASPDTNWVHYVHAAHEPAIAGSALRRFINKRTHRQFLIDEYRALHSARLVIANSDRTRRDVIEWVGVRPERVQTVYYGTDPSYHRPPTAAERHTARATLGWDDEIPAIAFVGALGDRRKGFDSLFAAWRQRCTDAGWKVRLVVAGAGQELAAWRARAVQAGLDAQIHFLGFTSDVRRVLWACDVIVAPSRYEAYGLAVHEAVCCGLPAIVSANAGVAERLLDLRALQLSDPCSVPMLNEALGAWYRERDEWSKRALTASTALRAWTWDDMAARIAALMTTSTEL